MNITVCFIGLTRTIKQTYENLKNNLYNDKDSFTTMFVTWEDENVDNFKILFPESTIYRFSNISIDDLEFKEWCKNTIMHNSWLNAYGSNALFNYYRQIYLWNKASIVLESYKDVDIIIRSRTDIQINGEYVKTYYNNLNESNIFFANEPRHETVERNACPDHIFFGKPLDMIKLLKIIDSVNYLYNKYNIPLNPETSLYYMSFDNNFQINYMNNSIDTIRKI